jgi:hypothetical protein
MPETTPTREPRTVPDILAAIEHDFASGRLVKGRLADLCGTIARFCLNNPGISLSSSDALLLVQAALRADRETLLEALRPFADIGLDVLKNRPGWANPVFRGEWCGYRLTYVQFEKAAAAALALTQELAATPAPAGPPLCYKRLPPNVQCRCISMWRAPDGSAWCCSPTLKNRETAL